MSVGLKRQGTDLLELRMAVALTLVLLALELWHLMNIWAWLGTGSVGLTS